jgi:putative heme-binding domain-containing protein
LALHADPDIDALVRKHWGSVKAGTPEEKLAEMRRLGNDLRAGPGDRGRGKDLFLKHCATCHKLFGEGGDVGPDLTGVARGDTTALLASIVDPGAVVRSPFLQYVVATRGGRVAAGLIAAQDNASVTLVDAQGKRTVLPRDEIEELRDVPTSIMPEGLLMPLDPQQVRDLFRYLQSDSP